MHAVYHNVCLVVRRPEERTTTAAVRSAPVARRARGQSRSRAAAAGPRRGGGGSLQHLPLLPLPAAQIKKQQKATNHPGAQRLAARRAKDSACGARTQQAVRIARRRLGRGAGLSGMRLSSSGSARTPDLAAASTSQLRLRRLCRRAARPPGQELRGVPWSWLCLPSYLPSFLEFFWGVRSSQPTLTARLPRQAGGALTWTQCVDVPGHQAASCQDKMPSWAGGLGRSACGRMGRTCVGDL